MAGEVGRAGEDLTTELTRVAVLYLLTAVWVLGRPVQLQQRVHHARLGVDADRAHHAGHVGHGGVWRGGEGEASPRPHGHHTGRLLESPQLVLIHAVHLLHQQWVCQWVGVVQRRLVVRGLHLRDRW